VSRALFPLFPPLAILAAVAFGPAAPPARAQCVPDLLDTQPCCTLVTPNLPVIPPISQSARFVCFRDCSPQINQNLCVDIGAPQPVIVNGPVCGVYLIQFKIKTCGSNQVLWQGKMRAHYARNWLENDPGGNVYGVWRFLLNGDLKSTAFLLGSSAGTNPNVVPACRASFGGIYVGGYVDYAFDCNNATWTAAWTLNHDCDKIHHQAGSPRPAPSSGFHPTRSFTFLGPGAGFVVDSATTPTPVGPIGNEALRRNDWSTIPNICRGEEQVGGFLNQLGSFCTCSGSPAANAQYDLADVSTMGACGSGSFASALGPYYQKRIGRWTSPAVFPGLEHLTLGMGDLDYSNACNLLVTTEFFEGVGTLGGFTATAYTGTPLGRTFLDLGSSNRSPTNMQRRAGVPHVTQFVMNLDLP